MVGNEAFDSSFILANILDDETTKWGAHSGTLGPGFGASESGPFSSGVKMNARHSFFKCREQSALMESYCQIGPSIMKWV